MTPYLRTTLRQARRHRGGANRCAAFLMLCAALSCTSAQNPESEKRPLDYLSLNQCNRSMTDIDQRTADMQALLNSGAPTVDVMEEVQRLRQDIVPAQTQCTANDAAIAKLKKLDKDLDALAQHLETDSFRGYSP